MQPELKLLIWSVVLMFVQMLVATVGAYQRVGLVTLAANREGLPEFKGWAGRARRAHLNMLENLILFAPLVLVAVLANRTDATTLLGAQIFFWARFAYAFVYVAGIPWVRTGLWVVSVVGLIMIFSRLV